MFEQHDIKRFKKMVSLEKGRKKPINEMSIREIIRNFRKKSLTEQDGIEEIKLSNAELAREEEKFRSAFKEYNVTVTFDDFFASKLGVLWGGTIDNQIQWGFKVTNNDETSGLELNFDQNFDKNNEDNKKIIDLIESYYGLFYKYWRDNLVEDGTNEKI